ncbi:MAG TPA: cytochrome c peroxidase [Candidatus Polarisedimenticolaceae bacterium]|nr:cytochrome c peroxidase [Candidatus Polarisedimenticolaceae bacterium]
MSAKAIRAALAFVILSGAGALTFAQQGPPPPPPPLPPVPVPSENPITENKRVLGKILFWDEQVSGDSTVACGTCHSSNRSGTDLRIGINPGPDANFSTPDDNIRSSPGVRHADVNGNLVQDPVFGFNVQVTRRAANAAVHAAYTPEAFWDGRAKTNFIDPDTGQTAIATGGALENQALAPILSSVEMGRDSRSWADVVKKLAISEPLGNATKVPADVIPAIAAHATYPSLFQAAFGDPAITAERIAFAIATYERTLIPNQTPWDLFVAGNPTAMTPGQVQGWNFFRGSPCAACHTPPNFTNYSYRNIGVRPPTDDTGREEVTGFDSDRGKFKVPTLRGVGLKVSYMHNGVFSDLQQVIAHYRPNNPAIFLDNIDPLLPVPVPPDQGPALVDFMANALTDPRVAAGTFPFDQPSLSAGALPQLSFDADKVTLRWPAIGGIALYTMYRGNLEDLVDFNGDGLPDHGYGVCMNGSDPDPTDTTYVDNEVPLEGHGFFYVKGVRDGSVDRGLGVTSSVQARVPAASCP